MFNNYEEVTPILRQDAEAEFLTDNPERISFTLIRLAYFDPDWRWVQNLCIKYINTEKDKNLRSVSIICLGHLARIHGTLDKELVIPLLKSLVIDSEIGGRAEDALDDIKIFLA